MKKGKIQLLFKAMIILIFVVMTFLIMKSDTGEQWIKALSEGTVDDLVLTIKGFGRLAPLVSMTLMVMQAFIAPIPSFLITGANGVVFGIFWGTVISWTGAMLGAAGTFYMARILGVDFVRRFEKDNSLLKKVDDISQVHGAKVIFVGRLMPFISFDFLSYAAGLSKIPFNKFFIATGFGMLPGTLAYVILGSQIMKYSGTVNQMLVGITIAFIAIWIIIRIYSYKKRSDQ